MFQLLCIKENFILILTTVKDKGFLKSLLSSTDLTLSTRITVHLLAPLQLISLTVVKVCQIQRTLRIPPNFLAFSP